MELLRNSDFSQNHFFLIDLLNNSRFSSLHTLIILIHFCFPLFIIQYLMY